MIVLIKNKLNFIENYFSVDYPAITHTLCSIFTRTLNILKIALNDILKYYYTFQQAQTANGFECKYQSTYVEIIVNSLKQNKTYLMLKLKTNEFFFYTQNIKLLAS